MTSTPPPSHLPQSPPRADALKSSILANSQAGWNSATVISPLKITKQQNRISSGDAASTPLLKASGTAGPAIPRRSSSSFKHIKNNTLVSNSPFKSPTLGSDDGPQGPIGPKYRPVPQSQSGGYKVLPRPSKIPGVTPRKPSPSIVGFRKGSPSQATRRASLEKRKRLIDSENFQKALALDALANADAMAGLAISAPAHPLGFPRRQSKGLQTLVKAEYVTKSPFIAGTKASSSTDTSPSLSSSTTSPQTNHQEESEDAEEPSTPTSREHTPDVEVQDERYEEHPSPSLREPEVLQPISPPAKASSPTSLAVLPVSSRPLPASPRSRRAASSFNPEAHPPPPSPPRAPVPRPSSATPQKSSLKSKRRLKGPRSPGSSEDRLERTASGRKRFGSFRRRFERRKTVTFDERCDVLEFERDDVDEGQVDSEWVTSEEEEGYAWDEQGHEAPADHQEYSAEYEERHESTVSGVDAIHGLVNSILQDEMAGFRDDDDSLDQSISLDLDRSIDDSRRSIDFNEANTSLDFHAGDTSLDYLRGNTSVDFQGANTSLDFHAANTSLDFHEGESFEIEFQKAASHLFDQSGRSQTIREEEECSDEDDDGPSILAQLGPLPGDEDETPAARALSPIAEASPFLQQGQGQGFSSNSTLSASESRVSQLSRSDSNASSGGRVSPRISREDVKRRLMKQRATRTTLQEEMEDFTDTEDEQEADVPQRPVSAFNRTWTQSTEDRPLPPLPGSGSSGPSMAPDMTRQLKSHDAVLQSTTPGQGPNPASASPIERSLTTDGNIPPQAYNMPPSHTSLTRPFDYNKPGVDINDVKSALDRLMIGVENGFMDDRTEPPPGTPHSRRTSLVGPSGNISGTVISMHVENQAIQQHQVEALHSSKALHVAAEASLETSAAVEPVSHAMQRAPSQSDDVYAGTGKSTSDSSSLAPRSSLARTKSGKEVLKEHEAHVIAKRREARRREGSQSGARPSKRRSMSTGDAEELRRERRAMLKEEAELLDMPVEEVDLPLTDSIDRELRKLGDEKQPTYRLREHEATIYATADKKVTHLGRAGDVDSGRAWRAVRRPSDMNEYAKQIRELRNQEKGKAHGKVFVKVLGIKGISVPLPSQPTAFNITLNNGIHCVATPDTRLGKDSRVDQEFELIEHGQLEFSLTLKIRKDPHVTAQMQANTPQRPTPPPPPPPPGMAKSGIFGLFGGKKTHKRASTQPEVTFQPSAPLRPLEENLSKYLRPDGTLASAFISFKDLAKRCDTRLFETSYPLMGQANDASRKGLTSGPPIQVGEIVMQLFRLPPLPGVKADQLPQSLEECHRGLRHIAWHKVTYHEGVLTQHGGDCSMWRRRRIQVIGANLVAFNDVTNKPTATIELKKAIAVVDNQDPGDVATAARQRDDDDEIYHVERSFRLIFPGDEIGFFCDTDEEKMKWLEILRALIGRIPPNPLWAELVWQRQEQLLAAQQTGKPS